MALVTKRRIDPNYRFTGHTPLPIASLGSWLAVTVPLLMLAFSLWIMREGWYNVPFWDQWDSVSLLNGSGPGLLTHLWRQHNEHRIPLQWLLCLADLAWFKGQNTFLFLCGLTVQIAHLALFIAIFKKWIPAPAYALRTASAVAGFCLFNPLQMENFLWGFAVTLLGTYLFATLAFFLLVRHSESPFTSTGRWLYVLVLLSTVLAVGSNAAGLLVALLLIPLALINHVRGLRLAGIVLLNAALWSAYLYDYHSPVNHTSPADSLARPVEMFLYIAYYLAGSWAAPTSWLSVVIGIFGLAVPVALVLFLLLKPPLRTSFRILLLAGCWLVLGTAVLTASGRLNFGFVQATSSRYQTSVLLFWCFLSVLVADLASVWVGRQRATIGLQIFLLVGTFVTVGSVRNIYNEYGDHGRRLQEGAIALALGLPHESLFPDTGFSLRQAKILRERQLSLFADTIYEDIGHPISSRLKVTDSNRCIGYIDRVELVPGAPGGARIVGWAWDISASRVPHHIVFCDRTNRIVGLAFAGWPRPDVPLAIRIPKTGYSGFQGLSRTLRDESELRAYAVLGDGSSACPFGAKPKPVESPKPPESPQIGKGFTPIWLPSMGTPEVRGGQASIVGTNLAIRSESIDPQVFFRSPRPLKQFAQIVIRGRFGHTDRVDLFFGKQVDGRSLTGVVPVKERWFTVVFPVADNPYWKREAGDVFRFDPASAGGVGSSIEIAGVWAREKATPYVAFEPLP